MGRLDKINYSMEIVVPVLGCSQREDCKAETLPGELLVAELEHLDKGTETQYGMTLDLVLEDRVTFVGMCNPGTCKRTGECALKGTFRNTTPEMAKAQDSPMLRISRDSIG